MILETLIYIPQNKLDYVLSMSLSSCCMLDSECGGCDMNYNDEQIKSIRMVYPATAVYNPDSISFTKEDGTEPFEFVDDGAGKYLFYLSDIYPPDVTQLQSNTFYLNLPDWHYPNGIDTDTIRFDYALEAYSCPDIRITSIKVTYNTTVQYNGPNQTLFLLNKTH